MPLKLDLAGDLDVENGRIHSPDPMRIFFTDQKFAYNGIVIFTSILPQWLHGIILAPRKRHLDGLLRDRNLL